MADLILYNARVITVDPQRPQAEAVAIAGDRIRYVGGVRQALSLASNDSRRINLQGRCLIPGFNDNHVHAVSMGDFFSRSNLAGMSCEQILDFLQREYHGAKPGELIVATTWDYPYCPNPHKSMLDKIFPHNPVVLFQFSGHAAWSNSCTLKMLGITRHTPDPPGGQIEHDAGGEPTGILREAAIVRLHAIRLRRHMFSPPLRRRLLGKALELLRQAGITSVQDNTWTPTTVWTLNELKRKGFLSCRFACWPYGSRPWLSRAMSLARYDSLWVRRGPWKYLIDGTFSSRTAWLLEPYNGEPQNYGRPAGSPEEIAALVLDQVRKRRQAAFHAIGDRAIHEIANAVESAREKYPWVSSLRLRIEHAQLIDPRDIPRLRDLGLLVAAQPTALGQPEKDVSLLGAQRAQRAYPFRSLLEAGVPLSFGSDIPGETSYEPLQAIHLAVNRSSPERITPLQALTCYTLGSAYAEFMEQEKGSITPGKLADLVVLSEDPTSVPPQRIKEITADMTIVGGKVVYESSRITFTPGALPRPGP